MARRSGKSTIAKYLAKKYNLTVITPSVKAAQFYKEDGIGAVYAGNGNPRGIQEAIVDDVDLCLSISTDLLMITHIVGFTSVIEVMHTLSNKREVLPPEMIEYVGGQHTAYMRGYLVVPLG